jgi:transcriptional regulator with XRE-family HTH domain
MNEPSPSAGVPTWDVGDRMRKGLRYAGVGVQEMADYLGVARSTLGNWLGGRIEPSTQTLRLWAMRCGIDYEWLAFGAVDNHVPAARAISEPGLNSAGYTARVVLLSGVRTASGSCEMQAAA